jgi:hypothetical protein
MTLRHDTQLTVRARATECAGLAFLAVGRDHAAPFVNEMMARALEGLTLRYDELSEHTYGFFAAVSEVLGAEFAPFAEQVLQLLLASCDSNEGVHSLQDDDDHGAVSHAHDGRAC